MAQDKKKDSVNIIGHGTTIEGKVTVPNSINISGLIKGELTIGDTITINTTGEIEGNVSAKNADIWGKVTGDITCSGRIELGENAVFVGNITTKELIIQRGAIFHGQSSMTSNSGVPASKPVA